MNPLVTHGLHNRRLSTKMDPKGIDISKENFKFVNSHSIFLRDNQ